MKNKSHILLLLNCNKFRSTISPNLKTSVNIKLIKLIIELVDLINI